MAAAIQHAAGGAVLGAASSPATADFTWRAVAAAAPRLLRRMQQRHACASAPRALHALLHRPSLACGAAGAALRRPASAATGASPRLFHSYVHGPAGAIVGANKQVPAMMGASRSFSSHDHDKFTNQLQEEEAKMKREEAKLKRKKQLAEALMNDMPTSQPGAKDHGVEIKSIDDLFGLLDVADAPSSAANDAEEEVTRHVAELRSLVEKRKNALLIELLGDGAGREQKKAELVDAGRRLRDALVGHDERRALQNLYTELKSLHQRVATAEYKYKSLSDAATAGRLEFESVRANVHSVRAGVSRLGYQVEATKQEAKEAQTTAESASTKVEKLEESVARSRKEAEAAYGLALFVGGTATVAAGLAALHIF